METYKRFEMVSSMEQCLKGIASKPTVNKEDLYMPDASSTLQDHVHSDIDVDSTSLVLSKATTNSDDEFQYDLFGPPSRVQPQKEMVPGEHSMKCLCLNAVLMMIFFIQ